MPPFKVPTSQKLALTRKKFTAFELEFAEGARVNSGLYQNFREFKETIGDIFSPFRRVAAIFPTPHPLAHASP